MSPPNRTHILTHIPRPNAHQFRSIASHCSCIGSHNVYVEVPDQGYALTDGLSPFQVNFKVTNMIPKVGSPLGGTVVKLSGQGFGNCSNVLVSMGELLSCKINLCTDTEIECVTERIAKTITIDNGGKHPRYGLGYVWNPSEVSVMPGDTIQWRWSITTSSVSGINILHACRRG